MNCLSKHFSGIEQIDTQSILWQRIFLLAPRKAMKVCKKREDWWQVLELFKLVKTVFSSHFLPIFTLQSIFDWFECLLWTLPFFTATLPVCSWKWLFAFEVWLCNLFLPGRIAFSSYIADFNLPHYHARFFFVRSICFFSTSKKCSIVSNIKCTHTHTLTCFWVHTDRILLIYDISSALRGNGQGKKNTADQQEETKPT